MEGEQAAGMAEKAGAGCTPVRLARQLLQRVGRAPAKGNPAGLEPAGGDNFESGRGLDERRPREPVIGRHKRRRPRKARLAKGTCAPVKQPSQVASI